VANAFAGTTFAANTFLTAGAAPAQSPGIRPNGAATKYAIAGIARSGATRSGYLPNMATDRVIVYHRGANRIYNVWLQTIQIIDNLYQQSDICTFRTWDWAPEPEDEIIVASGTRGRRYFGGIVTAVADEPMPPVPVTSLPAPIVPGSHPTKHPIYRVTCQDYMWRANALGVMGHWSGVSISVVMRDILTAFGPPGFSGAGIANNGPSISDMTFDGESKMSDAFDRLTGQVAWRWFMDPYGVVWAFDKRDQMATPLFAAAPGTPYYHFHNLHIQHASEQLKTRVNVKGGGGVLVAQQAKGSTIVTVDTVEYYPDPAVQTMYLYADGSVYQPTAINFGTKQITLPAPGLNKTLALGTKLNLWVSYTNEPARDALLLRGHPTGIIEDTLSDERRNHDGALALAAANAGAFGYPRLTGSYNTARGRAHSGDRLLIHLPYRRIWTEAQVQSVTTTLVNAPAILSRSVTFSDTRLVTFQDILRARERKRKDR
jgi:hypothetical protein